jgi:hypothetical protein
MSLMYRDGLLTARQIAGSAQCDIGEIEAALARLVAAGRVEQVEREETLHYRASALTIPLGASVGWEAAVFDHYKALVTTVLGRLSANRTAELEDRVGGSTYTIDVWAGHPLADEVYGTLGRLRQSLSDLRARAAEFNATRELPPRHTRVVIYAGQCVIEEGNEAGD